MTSEWKKTAMLARMRRWRSMEYLKEEYNASAKREFGKPYKSHHTTVYKDYWIEIGDSKYGKKGTWKAELDIGPFPEGNMTKIETELRLSNPEVFIEDEVEMRKIGYA
tara:strand:+ start:187 stop:510 length:324 start_codon:yes stop_codon:yes gene_type:complete